MHRLWLGDPPPVTARQARKPLYVVLRMDDIQVGYCGGRNTELSMIEWALARNIKLNLGVIVGGDDKYQTWPTDCPPRPGGTAGCTKAKNPASGKCRAMSGEVIFMGLCIFH